MATNDDALCVPEFQRRPAPQRGDVLPPLRIGAASDPAATHATPMTDTLRRAKREYDYCAQIRAAKERGETPQTAEEFFSAQ